jgi:hypothetical protein
MFPTFDIFCQVMDQCTENFECLVINNNAKSNRLEDQVFWYKADPHGDFKIGAPQFWSLSNECMQSADQDDNDFDPSAVRNKKRSHVISVKKNH